MNKQYTNKEMRKILQRELEMPVVVTEQLMGTLEGLCEDYEPERVHTSVNKYKQVMKYKKMVAVFAMVCILSCGAVATAVGLSKWNETAANVWKADEMLQDEMSENGVAVIPDVSATDNGVTVCVEQIVTDGLSEYILFKITAPEDLELPYDFGFHDFSVRTEGTEEEDVIDAISCSTLIKADAAKGKEAKLNEEKNVIYYQMQISLATPNALQGKTLSIAFYNLARFDTKQEETELLKGTWEMDILPEVQEYAMSMTKQIAQKMDLDKKASLDSVILSPMNIQVEVSYADFVSLEYLNGEKQLYEIMPAIKGVKLKDGKELEIHPWLNEYETHWDDKTDKMLGTPLNGEQLDIVSKECKDWTIRMNVDYMQLANTGIDNVDLPKGMINPEDVQSIILEYQGKDYECSIEK